MHKDPAQRKAYAKLKRQRRRLLNLMLVSEYKEANPCMDCNRKFPAVCMDFDHRPGEVKRFTVSAGTSKAWPALIAEVQKCDLVCSNCHRLRTWVSRPRSPVETAKRE